MAFLDNSGDIILDAVLTDLGRKRMSEGNFRITQFALGDDEVDYSLYNKNHPSGSAYYDLEILQTPVFEAFTRTNANINYGLLSFNGNPNLLYLPALKFNDTKMVRGSGGVIGEGINNIVYCSVNAPTARALESAAALGAAASTLTPYSISNTRYVLLESGLDTAGAPSGVSDNRNSYIIANGLLDSTFTILSNSNLISTVIQATTNFEFAYNGSAASPYNLTPSFDNTNPISFAASNTGIADYQQATIRPVGNNVYNDVIDTDNPISNISVIDGPRGQIVPFKLELNASNITTSGGAWFSLYGKTGQNLFSDGNTYDYIDTIVYVSGDTTGVTSQVTIRIIRKV